MGYYIRILSRSDDVPSLGSLQAAIKPFKSIFLTSDSATEDEWSELLLAHTDETPIALLERNVVREGELGSEEIEEFLEEIENAKPASAVEWLTEYLPNVKCIYAFQILSGADDGDGWEAIQAIRAAIFEIVDAILQADAEGFSNEEGFHILWQFSAGVKGPWWMAVLQAGEWKTFEMDLGNKKHRDAFRRGQIPEGVAVGRPG